MTIKQIADELGVSKQAVYKRAIGKLKSVLAPYMYTEYNRMCLTKEGADIIRKDFEENPCATPLFASGSNTEQSEAYTEQVQTHTESSIINTLKQSETFEQGSAPERSEHVSDNLGQSDTEYIRNIYEMLQKNTQLQSNLAQQEQKLHEQEIELIKSLAEIDKLRETVKHLEQRIDDKDAQLSEQRQIIQKTDNERKILTASLFRNNEIIEKLMQLPLSKRIFGWKDVRNTLMTSQTNEEMAEGESVELSEDKSD